MVKAYFTACEQAFPAQRTQLRRLALALGPERRGAHGAAVRHAAGPGREGLLELRSIGEKSLPLIAERSAPGMRKTEHHRKGVPPCVRQVPV